MMEIGALTGNQSQAALASTGIAQDFDTFLTLLTTQLQSQDPLDPLDSNEFTQQLVSFSGVEQQIRTNANLEQLANLFSANINTAAVGYLGKEAIVPGSEVDLGGQAGANWQYDLDRAADKVTIQIRDAQDKVILQQAGETGIGRHSFNWDGFNQFGDLRDQGRFRLEVVAEDSDGSRINSTVFIQDIVSQIDTSGGDLVLTVRGNEVSLNDVQAVREPR